MVIVGRNTVISCNPTALTAFLNALRDTLLDTCVSFGTTSSSSGFRPPSSRLSLSDSGTLATMLHLPTTCIFPSRMSPHLSFLASK